MSGIWTLPCFKNFFWNFILIWKCQKWSLNRVTLLSIYQQLPFTKRSALFYNSVHALYFRFQMLPYMILDYSLSVFLKKLRRAHLVFFQLGYRVRPHSALNFQAESCLMVALVVTTMVWPSKTYVRDRGTGNAIISRIQNQFLWSLILKFSP